jgi:hypothetical protein
MNSTVLVPLLEKLEGVLSAAVTFVDARATWYATGEESVYEEAKEKLETAVREIPEEIRAALRNGTVKRPLDDPDPPRAGMTQVRSDCCLVWNAASRTWNVLVHGTNIARYQDPALAASVALAAYESDEGIKEHHG